MRFPNWVLTAARVSGWAGERKAEDVEDDPSGVLLKRSDKIFITPPLVPGFKRTFAKIERREVVWKV